MVCCCFGGSFVGFGFLSGFGEGASFSQDFAIFSVEMSMTLDIL